MRPITPKDVDRHQHIFVYDDEPIMNLVVTLSKEEHPQEWWHVVVDVEDGGFAVGKVGDITQALEEQGAEMLQQPFSTLIGSVLTPVDIIVEMTETDMNALRDDTYATAAQVAVVLDDGIFRGVIPVGGTRSAGAFDTGLVGMAGQYGDIPEEGLLSKRRKSGKKKKKKSTK